MSWNSTAQKGFAEGAPLVQIVQIFGLEGAWWGSWPAIEDDNGPVRPTEKELPPLINRDNSVEFGLGGKFTFQHSDHENTYTYKSDKHVMVLSLGNRSGVTAVAELGENAEGSCIKAADVTKEFLASMGC